MRVLVICSGNLLASVIADLLLRENDLTVMNVINDGIDPALKLKAFKPDVIITDDARWPASNIDLCEALQTQIGVKILVVYSERNLINVFISKEIPITGSKDLLGLIYSN